MIHSPVKSASATGMMKSLHAEYGVPRCVVSDNTGNFRSDVSRRLADQWCFDHVTSRPHNPRFNGHIELQVQTVKRMLKKVGFLYNIQMGLLMVMAQPICSHLPFPAELLYGRRVVSNLPVATWKNNDKRCEIRASLDQRQAAA